MADRCPGLRGTSCSRIAGEYGARVACSSIGAYRRAARAVELLFPIRFKEQSHELLQLNSDKTNANARIRLQARFPIMWCFFAKFGLARPPIKVSAT
jgi:hypothetical protein